MPASFMSDLACAVQWCEQGLLSEAELQAVKRALDLVLRERVRDTTHVFGFESPANKQTERACSDGDSDV